MRPRSSNRRPQPISRSSHRSGKVLGRLVCHRDGYGFVIPEEPLPNIQGDIFIGAEGMGSAIHGDRVLVGEVRVKRNGRAEGRIQKILQRAHETIVGEFHYGDSFNYVVPYEERIPHRIVIPKGKELPLVEPGKAKAHLPEHSLEGMIVNVEITRFPTATQNAAGKVMEVLGQPGDFGVDVEIVIRKNHLPYQFPADALREAQ
ncbi:MAG: ribonuclease R, partial [Acidobacteria bacterium]|nr:ribonuclease R [Acidobacteriota bacterium]